MPTAALLGRAEGGAMGNDDPAGKPRRRQFTASYKLGILDEYDHA